MTFNKNSGLTQEQADQMLANIFEICRIEPNSVSLAKLEDYSSYRAERFTLRKILILLIILAFLAMPFLFMAPELTVANKTMDKSMPKYEIAVHSLLPVKSVTAQIDGKNIPVFETGRNVYTLEPEISGKMTVTATIINEQINTVVIQVDIKSKDKTPPALTSSRVSGDRIYLYVSDEESGVDYDSIIGLDADNNEVKPLAVAEDENCITFACPKSDTSVTIFDHSGNQLQLTLKP